MGWGIIIAFATLFGTMVLVFADALESDESSPFKDAMPDEENGRKAG